jgi:competence protein ComEC
VTQRRSSAATAAAVIMVCLALALVVGCGGTAREPSPTDGGSTATPGPSHHAPAEASPKASTKATGAGATGAGIATSGTRRPLVRLVFVDVGQGDAVILRAGSFDCLIDGGPRGAEDHLESELRQVGVRRLDLLVVTHPHADHIGDLPEVIRDFRPKRAVVDEGWPTATYAGVRRALSFVGTAVKRRFRGARLRLGSVGATVLSPRHLSGDPNADSVVLLLDVYGRRILLTGDVTGESESALGAVLAHGPRLFLLKVAHHGSNWSTSSTFLDAARPRFAVIEVGPNPYGYPSAETVGRLRAEDARVYSTRKNGDIWVTIAPSGKVTWRFERSAKRVTDGVR